MNSFRRLWTPSGKSWRQVPADIGTQLHIRETAREEPFGSSRAAICFSCADSFAAYFLYHIVPPEVLRATGNCKSGAYVRRDRPVILWTDGMKSFTENLVIAACQQDDGDEQLCGASFGYDLYDQIVPCPGQRMRRDLQRDARQRHVAVALLQIDGQRLSGLHLPALGRVQRQREPLLAAL